MFVCVCVCVCVYTHTRTLTHNSYDYSVQRCRNIKNLIKKFNISPCLLNTK